MNLTSAAISSKHLSSRHIQGLCKIGDILVCGDEDLASFSASGQVTHVDRVLDYINPQDLRDMKLLLWVFSWLPQPVLHFLWAIVESSNLWPSGVGATFRMMRLGIRGIVLALYYFEGKALQVIGYDVSVYTDDLKE